MLDRGLWDKFCRITGVNEWCINEGLASSASEYELDENETRQLLGIESPEEDEKSDAVDFWESEQAKPATFCIDCGQPTTPGKGSARCLGCWQDRCQSYEETPVELPVCLVCHGTDKYCGLCNGQSRRES